ncbi:MAG TPA: type II toxin-antitoxin system VapC family toxin [Bryobacteraceae bacterium]|nr:type II toxin-antitoxin system VapC family toxin [Bryobacteraceae bacterium]
MIVVDASAVLEILLLTPTARRVGARLFRHGETLHAPHLLDVEVAQAVRRYTLTEKLDAARGQAALDDFASFPLIRYPHTLFLPRIWQLRANLSAYDAAYVALAEALGATLITRDGALARSPGHHAHIEMV